MLELDLMSDQFFERNECPACGHKCIKSIFKRRFDDPLVQDYLSIEYPSAKNMIFPSEIFFDVSVCLGCELNFQRYVFKEECVGTVYNDWMDQNAALEDHVNNGSWKIEYYKKILKYAASYLKKLPGQISFLDYGAGFGASLEVASEMGFKVHAIEYSEARIAYLKSKGIQAFNGFHNGRYDFIICDQVLEHVTHPNELIKTISQLLAPNGLLYLAVPNCANIRKKLLRAECISNPIAYHAALANASIGAFQHINFFNNTSLTNLIRNNGLQPFLSLRLSFIPPITLKNFLRPFYHRYFSTVFFVKKTADR